MSFPTPAPPTPEALTRTAFIEDKEPYSWVCARCRVMTQHTNRHSLPTNWGRLEQALTMGALAGRSLNMDVEHVLCPDCTGRLIKMVLSPVEVSPAPEPSLFDQLVGKVRERGVTDLSSPLTFATPAPIAQEVASEIPLVPRAPEVTACPSPLAPPPEPSGIEQVSRAVAGLSRRLDTLERSLLDTRVPARVGALESTAGATIRRLDTKDAHDGTFAIIDVKARLLKLEEQTAATPRAIESQVGNIVEALRSQILAQEERFNSAYDTAFASRKRLGEGLRELRDAVAELQELAQAFRNTAPPSSP